MFGESFLNEPSYRLRDINRFADLFRFQDCLNLSCYALAQTSLEEQQDHSRILNMNQDGALDYTLGRKPAFPVCSEGQGQSLYDALIYFKNHLDEIIEVYYTLDDPLSHLTFLCLLCYAVFCHHSLIEGLNDDTVLLSGHMQARPIRSVSELLTLVRQYRQEEPEQQLNLHLVLRDGGSPDVRLFRGDMAADLGHALGQAVEDMTRALTELKNLTGHMERLLGIGLQELEQGDVVSAMALMKECGSAFKAMSAVAGNYYSV